MALIASIAYDPAAVVTEATSASLAMTALDTANLRIAFTAPGNGTVLVRLKGQTHNTAASTFPRILLGILEGATLRGRVSPIGSVPASVLNATQMAQEAFFIVTGLTPGNNYTFDAAYGVEVLIASSGLKYGGPNNNTINDAFGAFIFEIWETPTLLSGKLYDPLVAVTLLTTGLLAMTAMDTTNLRHTFNAPPSGKVLWRINAQIHGSTTYGQIMLGILEGATVRARSVPILGVPTASSATACVSMETSGVVTGLTPGNSYTFDAAYGVEVVSGAGGIKFGGPNNTTTNDAFGGIAYEIWAA